MYQGQRLKSKREFLHYETVTTAGGQQAVPSGTKVTEGIGTLGTTLEWAGSGRANNSFLSAQRRSVTAKGLSRRSSTGFSAPRPALAEAVIIRIGKAGANSLMATASRLPFITGISKSVITRSN